MYSYLLIFPLAACTFGVIFKKKLPISVSRRFFPMNSSSTFMVIGLMLKLHFFVEFTLVRV